MDATINSPPEEASNPMQHTEQQVERWDAIEQYFICISECSLHDGECVTHCVEVLKTQQTDSG